MEFEKKERISIRSKRLTSAVLAASLMATSTFAGIGPALAHVKDFSDTNPNAWYAHPVTFVSDNKYMVGYGGTDKFGIGENLTRAELAAILANYKGVKLDKDTTNKTGLSDIKDHKWYTAVCNWAVKEKLVVGYEDGTFRPNAPISREEIAAILCRFVDGEMGIDKELQTFPDKYSIGDWAWGSYEWATHYGVIFGIKEADGVYLRPRSNVTREQMAAMVERLDEYIKEYGYGYREDEDKPSKPSGPSYETGAPFLEFNLPSYGYVGHKTAFKTTIKNSDGKAIEWTVTKNGVKVTKEDAKISLDNKGGTLLFHKAGRYEVKAVLENHNGKKTTKKDTIIVLSDDKIIINAPENGYKNEPVKVEIIKPNLGKDATIDVFVERDGEVVQWEDVIDGELDLDGGNLSFKKKGQYELTITITDSVGRETVETIVIDIVNKAQVTLEVPKHSWIDTVNHVTVTTKNTAKKDIVWSIKKDGKDVQDGDYEGKLGNDGGDITFKKAGKYEITATVVDKLGKKVSTTKEIEILAEGQIKVDVPKYSYIGEATKVTVATDLKDATVDWTVMKDGQPFDYSQAGTLDNEGGNLTFTQTGTYEITATVTDAWNKKYTDKVTVTVLPVDEVGITANTDKTLINKPVDITIDESDKDRLDSIEVSAKKDGTPIKWNDYITGEITLDGGNLSFKEPGTYEITLTITDKGGKVFNKVITIVVEGEISFDVTAPEYVSVGTKATITTTLTNLNNKTITWSITKDGGPSSVDTSSLTNDGGDLTITEAGTYVLTATVNDGYGNDIKVEKTINVLPEITLDLTVNDYGHVGEPTDVTLVTTNLGANTVDWKITKGGKDIAISDLGTLDNEGGRLTFKEVGEYAVTATVTDQSGKKYTKKATVTVLENKAFDVKAPSLLQKQEEGTITIGETDKERIKEISMKVKKDGQDLILNDSNKGIVFGTITKDGGTIQFKQNGDYELTVITTDLSGKAFEKKFNIKVNAAPSTPTVTASFDLNQAHVKNPYTKDAAILLNKTAQSTDPDGDPITYEWDMGGLKVDENGYCKISDLLKDLESSVNWSVSAKAKDNHQGESDWGRYTLNGKPVQDFVKGINQSLTLEVPTTSYTNTATKITLTNENLNDKEITWVIEKDGKSFDYSQTGTLNNTGGSLNLTETGSYKVTAETLNIVGQKVSATKTVEVKAPVIAAGTMTLEAPEYIKQDEATVLTLAPKDMDNDSIQWTITKDGQPFDYSQAGSLTEQGGNLNLTEMGQYEITATGTDLGGKEVTVSKTVNVESKFWQITPDGAIKPSEKTKKTATTEGPYYQEFCAQDGLTIPETFMGITVKKIEDDAFYDDSGKGYEVKGKLTIPDTVTHIGVWAFKGCKGLTGSLILPEGLKNIGFTAFDGCSGFTGSLTIPEGVTNIESCTFRDCYGFNGSLIIPEGLQSIGQEAFRNCYGFNGTLTLPEGLQSIGNYAFRNCSGFTGSLTIPEGVTKIGQNTFSDCSGFNGSLTIPSSLTNMGSSSFENCSGLTGSLTIPEGVTNISWSTFKNCKGLDGNLYLPKSLTSIDQYAFENCSSLKGNISIPNVYKLGKEAFKNCSSLTGELVLPEGITSFAEMVFQNCSGLNSLVLPDDLTSIPDWTFSGCSGFSGPLTLPEGLQSIGNGAFYKCSGLTGSLALPQKLTIIGGSTFSGCSGFNGALTLPDGLQSIDSNAFANCSGLTGPLTLPNSLTKIAYEAFYGCSGFTGSLTIPEGVTSIGIRAFNGCRGFNGPLTLPEGLTTIEQGAFNYCVGLTGPLTFPSSLTSINSWMFDNCWKLPPYNWNNQSYPTYSEFLDAFKAAGNTVE